MDRGKDNETKFHLLTRFFNNLNHRFLNLKCNNNNNNNNKDNHNNNHSNNNHNNIKTSEQVSFQTKYLQRKISWTSSLINAQGLIILYQLIIRYTPPAREMTALFAKEVLEGSKSLLKFSEVKPIENVP